MAQRRAPRSLQKLRSLRQNHARLNHILFVVVVFLVILHLYPRWYLLRVHFGNVARQRCNSRNRSTRIIFYVDNNRALASSVDGLDGSVLKSLPVFVYSSETIEGVQGIAYDSRKGIISVVGWILTHTMLTYAIVEARVYVGKLMN